MLAFGAVSTVSVDRGLSGLPARLRRLRRERGWTLEQLAAATDLSKAYIARLESGDRQPSLAALMMLAQAFGLSVSQILDEESPPDDVVVRAGTFTERRGNGLIYRALSPAASRGGLQAMQVTVPASRAAQGDMYQHAGEEWLYVVSGRLGLSLGAADLELEAGEAAQFNATIPHRLVALGGDDVELLLVAAPVSGPVFSSYQAGSS